VTDQAHRAHLERRRAVLAARIDQVRTAALDHWRQAQELQGDPARATDAAAAARMAAQLEDDCHRMVAALLAIDDELGEGEE